MITSGGLSKKNLSASPGPSAFVSSPDPVPSVHTGICYRSPHYGNGFFAFGDGAKDEDLVKCGIQFIQGTVVVAAGATHKTKGPKTKLPGDLDGPITLRVTHNPVAQSVTFTAGKTTITHTLPQPPKQVTHVGFVTWNAVTDFGTLGVE